MTSEPISRRALLAGAGAAVLLAGCSRGPNFIDPNGATVAEAEWHRTDPSARVVTKEIVARPVTVDMAGRQVDTWAFDDVIGGPGLRIRAGEIMEVKLRNQLPVPTTIHWHGLAIRNGMDGVHDLTQPAVKPGKTFTYRFAVPDPGTYWFHPHTGLQLDRGLYSPLIVDEVVDPGGYDAEAIVVLDDWLDGMGGRTPDTVYAKLKPATGGMGDMTGMATSKLLGGDAGDVRYAMHLVNGRPPDDRPTFPVGGSGRLRLRVINAGSDTAYRFCVGGHRMKVTHTDGFPVVPVEVDTILIGMGERYDVTVNVTDGAWPFVAIAEGKDDAAEAVIKTTGSTQSAPVVGSRPTELDGQMLTYADLKADPSVALPGVATNQIDFDLTGSMMGYGWNLTSPQKKGGHITVRSGDQVGMSFVNKGTMFHPMHLHGHTFRLGGRPDGPRKDTVIVRPGERVDTFFKANNPGRWMVHCHNTYHLEAGMASTIDYIV